MTRRTFAVLTLLLTSTLCHAVEPGANKPNVVPGCSLPDPQKFVAGTKSYVKVTATCDGSMSWDVEAQFDADGVTFDWELLSEKTALIGLPGPGVIKIQVVGQQDGKPTKFCKTYIEVVAAENNEPGPAPSPQPPAPPRPAVGTLHAFAVLDYDQGTEAAAKVANSATLRQQLNGAGVKLHVLSATSAVIGQQGLTRYVAQAGGAPALILVGQDGKVYQATKLPASEADVLSAVKAVLGQ